MKRAPESCDNNSAIHSLRIQNIVKGARHMNVALEYLQAGTLCSPHKPILRPTREICLAVYGLVERDFEREEAARSERPSHGS